MKDDHKDYCNNCGSRIDEENKAEQFGIVEHNDEGVWKVQEVVTRCQICTQKKV